jgi:hypothetical protein
LHLSSFLYFVSIRQINRNKWRCTKDERLTATVKGWRRIILTLTREALLHYLQELALVLEGIEGVGWEKIGRKSKGED